MWEVSVLLKQFYESKIIPKLKVYFKIYNISFNNTSVCLCFLKDW